MYKLIAISALFLAAATAVPTVVERTVTNPNTAFCGTSVTYDQFECCDTDVLPGVLALGCRTPSAWPDDCDTPQSICDATGGGHPKCCTVPLLGLGVLCQNLSV